MILLYVAIVGWCGNVPRPWPFPRPRPGGDTWLNPQPEPPGEFIGGIIGAIGGVGAWEVFGARAASPGLGLLETTIVAFFGGVFLGSLVRGLLAFGRKPQQQDG